MRIYVLSCAWFYKKQNCFCHCVIVPAKEIVSLIVRPQLKLQSSKQQSALNSSLRKHLRHIECVYAIAIFQLPTTIATTEVLAFP